MHIHMQKTRQEIVEILKRQGEGTVEELSTQLELTPTCIRQHVAVLERDGLIESREVRRKIGRPHYVFSLTAQADAVFPQHYDLLAGLLLDAVRANGGDAGVETAIHTLAERLATHFESRLRDGNFAQRLNSAIGVLDELGAMAELVSGPTSALTPPQRRTRTAPSAGAADSGGDAVDADAAYIVRENNCPFRRVSQDHPELCDLTQHFLEIVLDADVACLPSEPGSEGDIHPCTYHITPRKSGNVERSSTRRARA